MYKEHQGGTLIDISFDNKKLPFADRQGKECFVDMLSVSATVKEKRIHITAANLSVEEEAVLTPELYAKKIAGNITLTLLQAKDIHDCNTYENPDNIKTVTMEIDAMKDIVIPPASVVAISFEVE